jgi:hypothetical protein
MEVVEIGVSPKQLSKIRNGHKVRVKKPIAGKGICMIVKPEKFQVISKAFLRGRGAEISLSPEEIQANVNASSSMAGKGIFGDRFDKFVEDTIGKKAKDTLYQGADYLKKPIQQGIDKLAEYAPELGASALSGLALAVGQPELIPLAGMAGKKLGEMVGKKGANYAKDYLDRPSYYQNKEASDVPQPKISSSMINRINQSEGTNMGYMERAGLESAQALMKQANMLKKIQSDKLRALYPNSNISQADIDRAIDGEGLYAGGKGLYAESRGRGSCKALISGRGARVLPPALQSQPYSANFQFRSTMPPAYQMTGKGLYA